MDSSNERLIHDQLIESASKEGTSQYILIFLSLFFIIIYIISIIIVILINMIFVFNYF